MEHNDLPLAEVFAAAGGKRLLAQCLKCDVTTLYSWKRVPAGRLADVAKATGIPASRLRPDLAAAFVPVADVSL
jgi:hypothetical protein